MRTACIALVSALAASAACRSGPPPVPSPAPAAPQPPPKPRIALVLGGGAARGFAHVGVIRELEQEKIPIDLVVGTSVGSLIGAIYAADLDSFDLEWTAFKLQKDDLLDYGVLSAVMGMGLARGDKLEEFVRSRVKVANIEDLRIPFAAVATDLNWGTKVVLDRGSVARAVRASSAIPGVFQPVQHMGKILVDGGVVDNIPISVARAKGADIVVAVDISENVGNTNITNLVDVMIQATNIMFALNVAHSKKDADVLIAPKVGDVGMLDFTQKKRCMQAGIEAARAAAPAIHRAVDAWVARRMAASGGAAPPAAP
ncbi:MAG TPA: patatin-like phospholipase family protein [Anaeromyxobacteraceae bacterium]|nr:patatin-like phospholipase family protein [Anaeromyxobacteraceae bacterium]